MRTEGLSFEQIPPLQAPFGFFLAAPLFGVLAGLLILLAPETLLQRWSGAALALTHLLSLGFGGHVMLGALYQVIPVVSSQALPQPDRLAPLVRWALTIGTLLLAAAFYSGHAALFVAALPAIGLALLLFGAGLAAALIRARPAGDTVQVLRWAAAGLLITLLLGVIQTLVHAFPGLIDYRPSLTGAHLQWAAFGWILLLVIGVSLQVIPMFQVTPAFPRWIGRWLPPALVVALTAPLLSNRLSAPASLLIGTVLLVYAVTALRLLRQRKRKLSDYSVHCWQLALAHLLLLGVALPLVEFSGEWQRWGLLLAALFSLGFTLSVILGMLHKIVPFLIYLHLQRSCLHNPMAITRLPNMKQILPAGRAKGQWWLQLALLGVSYSSLLAATIKPAISPIAAPLVGSVMIANFGWLLISLWRAMRCYRHARLALVEP